MKDYIQFYTKTSFSLLKSTIRINEYVEFAKKNNVEILGITDETVMYGTILFYNKCIKEKIKPIIGLEIPLTYEDGKYKILLYAKNYDGLINLYKISTFFQRNKEITYNDLTNLENIIIVTPFEYGHIERLIMLDYQNEALEMIKKYEMKFKNFYLGIDPTKKEIYKKINNFYETNNIQIPKLFIHEVCSLTKEQTKIQTFLEAINFSKTNINPLETFENYYLESIETKYAKSTNDFASKINIEINNKFQELPNINEENNKDYFINLVKKGFLKRYSNPTKLHYERLNKELKVIIEMNFINYFLIVYDLVNFAKKNEIMVGPGRGSAASSIIAYSLGITAVCPIQYNLLFERFLNLERISMPDIDLDFQDNKRYKVVDYLKEKYGENHVAKIMTLGTFGTKQALRDIGKVLGIEKKELENIMKQVNSFQSINENFANPSLNKLITKHKHLHQWFYIASKIEGLGRHTSIHAAGIVLSKESLLNLAPLTYEEMYVVQFSMNELEQIGLLKIDLLGLRNLTILQDVLKSVNLTINQIPLNDQKTFDLISKGNTNGIFQLESEGVKKALQKIKPQSIEEISLTTAMYRPGPMENIPQLVQNKNGKFEYLHKDLEHILKETYGIIVYQEQIMQIANVMANYSLSEADLLRKGISKKNQEIIDNEKEKFISNALAKGYEIKIAQEVFNLIEKFSNYGFNKAHAISYSIIAYQLSYLKANYPKEFIASILKYSQSSIKTLETFIFEAKKIDLKIMHPNLMHSNEQISIVNEHLYLGFTQIKGFGKESVQKIIEGRNEFDFSYLVNTIIILLNKGIGIKSLETLVYSCAFDCYGHSKNTVLNLIYELEKYKDLQINPKEYIIEEKKELEYDFLTQKEKEVLGIHLGNHPVLNYRSEIDIFIEDLPKKLGNIISIKGQITKIYEKNTKNNKKMAMIEISDESGLMSVTIFPNLYEIYKPVRNEIIEVTGKVEKYQERYQINANSIKILNQ